MMISSPYPSPGGFGYPKEVLSAHSIRSPPPMRTSPSSQLAQESSPKESSQYSATFQSNVDEQSPLKYEEASQCDYRPQEFTHECTQERGIPPSNTTALNMEAAPITLSHPPPHINDPHSVGLAPSQNAFYGVGYPVIGFHPVYYGFSNVPPPQLTPPQLTPHINHPLAHTVLQQQPSMASYQPFVYVSDERNRSHSYVGPELSPAIAVPRRRTSLPSSNQFIPSPDSGESISPHAFNSALLPESAKLASHSSDSREQQLGKRTKVSRACDECRRKKTRCNIDLEHEICSPCRRAGVSCTFSRAQLKRGPAKKRTSFGQFSTGSTNNSLKIKDKANRERSVSISSAVSDGFLSPMESLHGHRQGILSPRSPSSQIQSVNNQMDSPQSQHEALADLDSRACSQSGLRSPVSAIDGSSNVVDCKDSEINAQSKVNASNISIKLRESKEMSETKKLGESIVIAVTPPAINDISMHGVSHSELMQYYTFVHSTFPLLPDLVSEVDAMFKAAGPAKGYLIAALNGTSGPEGLLTAAGEQESSQSVREFYLIALLLTYLRTLESVWLDAAIKLCDTLVNDSQTERRCQLAALVVAFETIHSVISDSQRIVSESVVKSAQECKRSQPLLMMLRVMPEKASSPLQHFITSPEAALTIFGKLSKSQLSRVQAIDAFQPLLPQLHRTPLENFVKKFIS